MQNELPEKNQQRLQDAGEFNTPNIPQSALDQGVSEVPSQEKILNNQLSGTPAAATRAAALHSIPKNDIPQGQFDITPEMKTAKPGNTLFGLSIFRRRQAEKEVKKRAA